jgi:RNA polymerase sigma-70 factor (ECF subfamily)
VIHAAAHGDRAARSTFAHSYLPVVRAYLGARWRSSPLADEVEDAVQEVFLDCLRGGGALERASPDRPGGFRAFLYGVVRNVALRVETRRARRNDLLPSAGLEPDEVADSQDGPSRAFDRAWAFAVVESAAARQAERARLAGAEAERRVELLRLRFEEGLPIREVAARWGTDPALLHREYARARREFEEALRDVVGLHHPGPPGEVGRECARLLDLLG